MSAYQTARTRLADPRTLTAIGAILWIETVIVGWYVLYESVRITDPFVLVYPVLWIDVSLLAIWLVDVPKRSRRFRRLGALLALGYFIVLAWAGGLFQIHALHGHVHATGVDIEWQLPPGWSPMVLVSGSVLGLSLVPYKVIGYLTLTYLVYATVLDTMGSAWVGVVGLFSCVSCTWPILGTVLAGTLGSSSVIVALATKQPYWASAIVFVSAVGLLLWRPFAGLLGE